MKRNNNILFFALFLIIAFGFTAGRLLEAQYLREQYTTVSIRFKTEGVTEDFIKNALENEKSRGALNLPEITAWTQLSEAKAENPGLNRSVQIPVLYVAGDMSLTAPMTLLYGNFVYREDKRGCVIDMDTAFKLYGTEHAVGNRLSFQGIDYYIRGVVKTKDSLLLLQKNDRSEKYLNLEVVYPNKEQGESLTEDFLLLNNFPSNYVILDGYFYGRMLGTLFALTIWVFFVVVCFGIMKILWKKKQNLKGKRFLWYGVASIFIMLGYGAILYQFTGNPFYIPEKLIPTRFSDFDYWGEQYKLIKEQLRQLQYLIPNQKDIFLEKEANRASLNIAVAVLLYIICLLSGFRMIDVWDNSVQQPQQ